MKILNMITGQIKVPDGPYNAKAWFGALQFVA